MNEGERQTGLGLLITLSAYYKVLLRLVEDADAAGAKLHVHNNTNRI